MAAAQSDDEQPDASPVDDPGGFTVAQVQEWVEDNPDMAADVLDAEQAGKARTTLVAWLEAYLADDDDEDAET
jgi:hypothetical protein